MTATKPRAEPAMQRPTDCPPELWEKVAASALAHLADPSAPRSCPSLEECLWQGRADAMARGLRMPAHVVGRLVTLHRPYLLPGVEQDPAA